MQIPTLKFEQNGCISYPFWRFLSTFMDKKLPEVVETARNNTMKILRELNNYTQEYVASVLGINQNSYYKLESGQTRLTADRMKKLAELYNIEPEVFLSNTASIVHYNKGAGSNSNSGYIQTYKNGIFEEQKMLYEKIILEKETQIRLLSEQLKEYKQKEKQLLFMLEKISEKV